MNILAIAGSGLNASQFAITAAAQDAANANTLAYKSNMPITTSSFFQTISQAGSGGGVTEFNRPSPIQIGQGSKISGMAKIMTQGDKKDTGNPLDLFINGNGYFAINRPNGKIGYTRVGVMRLNSDRKLVTMMGNTLIDDITIPMNVNVHELTISDKGIITNSATGDEIGRIQLAIFPNETGLKEVGDGILEETTASGEAIMVNPGDPDIPIGSLIQSSLEMSNISPVEALTSMIAYQRNFEMNLKFVTAGAK